MEKNSDEIRVEIEDGKAKLYTPYNKDFIDKYIGWKPVTLVMGGKPRSRT